MIGKIAVVAMSAVIALGIGFALPKDLKADEVTPEVAGNTIPTATTTYADKTCYGEITADNKIDYWKITIPSSGRIKFTINFGSYFKWQFYNSDEECLWDNSYSGENRLWIDLNKGTYYLRIAKRDYSDYGTYNFYYKFLPSGESFGETGKGTNNLISQANTIGLGKVYNAFIADNDEIDYYKFTLNAPGKINMVANNPEDLYVTYYILDKNGDTEYGDGWTYTSPGENKNSIVLSKGVHYIEFIRRNNRTGAFNFKIDFEGIKFSDTVKTVVCGSQAQLSVDNAGRNKITWTSSNKSVAQVSSEGVLMANKAGPVTIMATVDGTTIKRNIQVLYKDVTDPDKFWYEPTNALTNKGIVQGYDRQTTFKPENNCTRAQMVTFLWRLKGTPNPKASTTKFKDVKKNAYYFKAVIWATERGITTGYSKTSFKPNNVCTRAQTVTFLWRMAGKPTPKTTTNKFKDIGKKDYFYKAVLWASEKKIVEGYSNKTFRPQNKCTRRQMVTFLYKYSKNVK